MRTYALYLLRSGILPAALVLFTLPLAAQQVVRDSDLFATYGIQVDVSAATATQARAQALNEAERTGLSRLLRKIATEDALGRLPDLTDAQVDRLVRVIEVAEERRSSRRYIATINVSYSAQGIRTLLGTANIPYSEIRSEPVLLLPGLRQEGSVRLYHGDNPWARAWAEAEVRNNLVQIIVPAGDFRDRMALTPAALNVPGAPWIERYAEDRYRATGLLMAEAELEEQEDGYKRLHLRYAMPGAGEQSFSLQAGSETSTGELYARGVDRMLARLNESWKQNTLSAFGDSRALALTVMADRIENWIDIRRRLERVSIIRQVTLQQLSLPENRVSIRYQGTMDQLRLALEQRGLVLRALESDGGGVEYILNRTRLQAADGKGARP